MISDTLVVVVVNGYDYVIGSRTLLRAMLGAVVLVLACAGATWAVDDGGGAGVDYASIQAAVDAASAGDANEVRDAW